MNKQTIAVALAFGALALPACTNAPARPAAGEPKGEAESTTADLDRPLSEIFSERVRCEHGIAQYTCDECRYELGVVKVDPALADGAAFAVERVAARPLGTVRETTGEVRLDENRSTFIGPRAPGIVRAIHADVGDRVRAGQVLFEVETTELGDARAAHAKAHAAAALARTTLAREEELFRRRVCPEKDVLEARAALAQADAEEGAAHQRLVALGLPDADVDARDDHTGNGRRTPVRAPFAGTVLERALNLGALVTPGEKNLLLADTSSVWIATTVHERELAAILERQRRGPVRAEVIVPAYEKRVFPGRVTAVGGVLDEATRTATARVVVDNAEDLLRRGMFAKVRLLLDGGEPALGVPADAVLEDGGRTFVFVRHDATYFVRRPVTTGRRVDGRVEIASGLAAGDTIATRGAFLLKSDVLRSKMGAGCAD